LYSKVRSYASVSRAALKEMYRQTGEELVYDKDGLLKRGLVIRLLVLPNDIGSLRDSLQWIRDELSPRVAVSLMAQYYPTNVAGTNQRYMLLSRSINESEWLRAVSALEEFGMEEGWMQEYDGAAFYYRPDFNDNETPFRDVRDFQ
jgi:putative pyruvate formate lyase activating enzyme